MPNPEHKEKIYQFVNKAIQFNKHHNIFQRTSAEEEKERARGMGEVDAHNRS